MVNLCKDTVEYMTILKKDPCSYCGEKMEHLDHIDAVIQGGSNHWSNLTAACQPCNRRKWDKPLLSFLSVVGN